MISVKKLLPHQGVGQLVTLLVRDDNREQIFLIFFFPQGGEKKDYLHLLPTTPLYMETLDNKPVTL